MKEIIVRPTMEELLHKQKLLKQAQDIQEQYHGGVHMSLLDKISYILNQWETAPALTINEIAKNNNLILVINDGKLICVGGNYD